MYIISIVNEIKIESNYTIEIVNIVSQNNPDENWQKFCEIKIEYENNCYIVQEFHSRIDLNKDKCYVKIYHMNNGEIYIDKLNGFYKYTD